MTLSLFGAGTLEEKLPELLRITNELTFTPFRIIFDRIGCFKRFSKELWWIGTSEDNKSFYQLKDIHKQLNEALIKAGFSPDPKPFKAHITIAREVIFSQNSVSFEKSSGKSDRSLECEPAFSNKTKVAFPKTEVLGKRPIRHDKDFKAPECPEGNLRSLSFARRVVPIIVVSVDHISLMKSERINGVLTYTEIIKQQA